MDDETKQTEPADDTIGQPDAKDETEARQIDAEPGAKKEFPETDPEDKEEATSSEDEAADEEIDEEEAAPVSSGPADKTGLTTDIFAWANNLVQYKDELVFQVYFFNRNYVLYKTARSKELDKQLEPIFIDEALEYVLNGADKGLIVRGFEQAEAEDLVLQATKVENVQSLVQTLNWLNTQEHEMETFREEDHDIKRVKGVVARVSHPEMKEPFYVIKQLSPAQVMKGKVGWMLRGDKLVPFDAEAAVRIPSDNQLLVIGEDLFVFNQSKLKSLFGYDAKEAWVAEQKVREIEENFKLSFSEGATLQTLIKDKKAAIKKLQKVEPSLVKQDELVNLAEELNVGLMTDDSGAIIMMDDKDVTRFVNLLNDDYVESALTGQRYEIISKRLLKPPDEEELMKGV